jgi:putative ABC transport system ATP-binding protein
VSQRGLKLCDVVKHYPACGEVVRAVDGVSLTVEREEVVVVYGPSGSGKSTLLLLAAGLLKPDAGAIHFGDRDVGALGEDDVRYQRREIGFVSQSFDLMPGVPAVENAAVKLLADRVPLSRARRRAIPWLERVGLEGRLDHTPEQLSGGERQRVAIARALVNEPRLILADEPTGNLDSRRSQDVLALLRSIGRERGAAVLIVTHDPHGAAYADRVLALRDGKLLPDESPPTTAVPLPAHGLADSAPPAVGSR